MHRHSRQKGAALVIGLMLLVIVTVLAVSAVGTASTELTMAGNEQFRQRAFQAAEIGIESGLRSLYLVPQDGVAHAQPAVAVPALPTDNYIVSSIYLGDDDDIPGYSAGKFVGIHYRIDSTGNSQRNAKSVHQQGAYVIGSGGGGGVVAPLPGAGAP